jgi:hypothetical protein
MRRLTGIIGGVSAAELTQTTSILERSQKPLRSPGGRTMQTITFCTRCRGIRIGWNRRYILHCLTCTEWVSRSTKLLVLTIFLATLAFAFPTPGAISLPDFGSASQRATRALQATGLTRPDPHVATIETFLHKHQVDEDLTSRIASAIVASGQKYDLDPRLIASVIVVESRGNPFAISESDAVGIMQIHLATWGTTADKQGINLFKIEDNVDLGARILRDYSRQFGGIWEGVKRYKGWNPDSPESMQNVQDYIDKVQGIYTSDQPNEPLD